MPITNFAIDLSLPNPVVTWDGDDGRSYELTPSSFGVSLDDENPELLQGVKSAVSAGATPQGHDALCILSEAMMGACLCIEQITDDNCVLCLGADTINKMNQFTGALVSSLQGWLNDHLSVQEAMANSNQGITLLHSNADDSLHVHLVSAYKYANGNMVADPLSSEVYASDSAVSPFENGTAVFRRFESTNLAFAIHQAKEWTDNGGQYPEP